MIPAERETIENQPEPDQHSIADLADPLFHVPNDGPHDKWINILMAVHHATGGSKSGLNLVKLWSENYPEYDSKEVTSKWHSFGKYEGAQITAETLFAEARDHGWKSPIEWDDDELEVPKPTTDDLLGDSNLTIDELHAEDDQSFDYKGLSFLTPADCAATDPRPYVIKGILAERDVACLVGAPGVGKSLLAPYLAYAVAQGKPVFDRRVQKGGVFYVAAEGEHGMRDRLRARHDDLGDAPNLHLVGGISDLLATELVKVKGKTRQRCRQADTLVKAVRDHKPALIVIDTLAMPFPGLEENSAEGMGRVVALARRLTKWGAAVVLVHHDTKDGQQGLPRGHSLLNGALDMSIHLRKSAGGIDADGDPVTTAVCVPCKSLEDDRKSLKPTERAALDSILEMMEGNSEVDEHDWRQAAQKDARITTAEKPDSRRRVVSSALKGLAQKEEIAVKDGVISIPQAIEDDGWPNDDGEEDHVG